MTTIIITPPTEEPVTLAEVKLNCRIDGTDEDTLLTSMIVAARQRAEHLLGRALCTQTLEVVLDEFPSGIKLQPKIQSVTSLKYIDITGTQQTLNSGSYLVDLDSEPGWIVPAYGYEWPETQSIPNAVRIRYVSGYGAASAVPNAIKQWMLVYISTMYSERSAVINGSLSDLPREFFAALLDPYRVAVM
jgi:uncharacterized phiE125 gp8 family phage protein